MMIHAGVDKCFGKRIHMKGTMIPVWMYFHVLCFKKIFVHCQWQTARATFLRDGKSSIHAKQKSREMTCTTTVLSTIFCARSVLTFGHDLIRPQAIRAWDSEKDSDITPTHYPSVDWLVLEPRLCRRRWYCELIYRVSPTPWKIDGGLDAASPFLAKLTEKYAWYPANG